MGQLVELSVERERRAAPTPEEYGAAMARWVQLAAELSPAELVAAVAALERGAQPCRAMAGDVGTRPPMAPRIISVR